MIPVRCFSCNKVLGNKGQTFKSLRDKGVDIMEIWNILGLSMTCCRTIMLSHIDIMDDLMKYCDYNPSKYIEIRKQPPKEEKEEDLKDLNLEDLSLEDDDDRKCSSSPNIFTSVLKKNVRVYDAV